MNGAFKSQPSSPDQAVMERQNTEKQLARFDSILGSDPRQFVKEREIQHAIMDTFSEANRASLELPGSRIQSNLRRVAFAFKLMRSGIQLSDQILALNQQHLVDSLQRRKQQDFLLAQLEALVFISFACGSSLSAILFLDFAKSFLRRLKVLRANASSLAGLEAPTEGISGNDEVAYLDSFFRAVASELKVAREEQQSIVQMIAHDMRSPIMAAQISISTFEEFFVDALPDSAIQWCEQITAASDQVLNFVNDLLTIEALESGTIVLSQSQFSLQQLVQACILSLSNETSIKALSIENTCIDTILWADKSRIAQVITIYLANAIEAAPERSHILVSSQTKGDFEIVFVHDAGQHLSKGQRRQAFDRYSKTNSEGKGATSGLGLFICRMLVENHGGKVAVTSEPGAGRTFQFMLPKIDSREPAISDFAETEEYLLDAAKRRPGILGNLRKSLIAKVLLLVLLPIIAQGVWLMWIDGQLVQSQKVAMRERQQADLVSIIDELWLRLLRANTNSVLFAESHTHGFGDRTTTDIQALRATADSLDLRMSGDSTATALWHHTKDFIRDETRRIAERVTKWDPTDDAGFAHLPDFIVPALDLNARVTTVSVAEVRTLSVISHENEASRRQLQYLVFLAIPLNIILSTVQWWVLRKDITKRIAILIDNARKLPVRGRLKVEMGGCDEIAVLDSLLHRAARELTESDSQRKCVINMIGQNICNPLATIAHFISLLETKAGETPGLSAKGKEALVAARRNISRVQMLSDDLLTIDQYAGLKNELDLCMCNIAEVIEESVTSVSSLASESSISFDTDIADIAVLIDKNRMIQVLVNLLANSVKFSPAHSAIQIRAQTIAGGLRITVQDRGPGMDKATTERVFDKFFRSDNQNQQAFGLGLAICRLIVEAHGGQIGVESAPEKGSTFWIEIQAARGV
jgi:signal transduction histidine kinase